MKKKPKTLLELLNSEQGDKMMLEWLERMDKPVEYTPLKFDITKVGPGLVGMSITINCG